ncbi:MAG: sulfite reductase [Deltaproteobacteria bacterium]|nr:MAG: sulfite reductase [Deltaproteobacteria bacterium]
MQWTENAKKELERVPFFVRKKVKTKIENFAEESNSNLVRLTHLKQARQQFVKKMENEVKGHRVEACFGGTGCKNAIDAGKNIADKIDNLLKSKKILSFLKKNTKGSIKFHQEFKVSISFCPNSCSRPQINDVGIIAANIPFISDEKCSSCSACVKICMEKAISFQTKDFPSIDFKKCIYCGECIKTCPTHTISSSKKGFRVLLGGKLGRHPRLGIDMGKIFSEDEVIKIVDKAADIMLSQKNKAERFSEIFKESDMEKFLTQ